MTTPTNEESIQRITQTDALKLGVTKTMLKTLECVLATNPYYRSAAPMKLYVREEVLEKAKQVREQKEARLEEKKRKKLSQLERKGVQLNEGDPCQMLVLDAFMKGEATLTKTVKAMDAVKWMNEHGFRGRRMLIHPVAHALSLLKSGTRRGTVRALIHAYSNLASKMLSIALPILVELLSPTDLKTLKETYPFEVSEALAQLSSRAHVRAYMVSRLHPGALERREVQAVLRRAILHPFNNYVGKDAAIQHINDLVSSTPKERRERLEAFHVYREDSTFCKAYIDKTTDAYLREVVGVMKITQQSFWCNSGHPVDRQEREAQFRVYVERDNMSWEDAANKVTRKIRHRRKRRRW